MIGTELSVRFEPGPFSGTVAVRHELVTPRGDGLTNVEVIPEELLLIALDSLCDAAKERLRVFIEEGR